MEEFLLEEEWDGYARHDGGQGFMGRHGSTLPEVEGSKCALAVKPRHLGKDEVAIKISVFTCCGWTLQADWC
jgi:hypothetical protein